jgi:hypothetical protein
LLVHPNYKDFANFSNATNKQTRNYPQIQPSQKLVGSVNLSYTLPFLLNYCHLSKAVKLRAHEHMINM